MSTIRSKSKETFSFSRVEDRNPYVDNLTMHDKKTFSYLSLPIMKQGDSLLLYGNVRKVY